MDQVTISRETAKQAIEAMSGVAEWVEKRPKTHPWDAFQRLDPAIIALRTALEQPAEGRVATQWLAQMIMSDCGCSTNNQRLLDRIVDRIEKYDRANAAPQAQQPRIGTVTSVEQTLEQWEHDFNNPMTHEQQVDWVKREREFASAQAQQPEVNQ